MSSSQSVSFCNRSGLEITGILHKPAHAISSSYILLCHGLLAHKNAFFFKELAESIPLITFRFDFPFLQADKKSFRYASFQVFFLK